jgi:hypothetical protein
LGYYGDDYYADNGYYNGYYGDDAYGNYDQSYASMGDESSSDNSGYCSQRYRSYDPASGTYLGYDGRRHPCP